MKAFAGNHHTRITSVLRVTTSRRSAFTSNTLVPPGFRCAAASSRRKSSSNTRALRVVAYKETDKVTDWRVDDMVKVAHKYFADFLSKGNAAVAADIFDDAVVHRDVVWDPVHPTVGIKGMEHLIQDLKSAFPDFWVDIREIATCDTNSIWVLYEGCATGLGEYHGHKGTHHSSVFSGVNILKFSPDRSRIVEVAVYRSAFAEDREELRERVPEGGFRELRLKRLV